ncbi:MAG: hypothetical protein ACKPKO_45630, partial [Candidatus Fonsibacter sp.]
MNEAKRRRLELDLAEVEASLKRNPCEAVCPSSSCYPRLSANDTTTKVKCEEPEKDAEKTHKQKQNERRRAIRKHKKDRICDVEMMHHHHGRLLPRDCCLRARPL